MMISPEVYYEMFLKGRSEQELLKEMRSLRTEIAYLKNYLEKHPDEPEVMYPTRLTRLKCSREYYECAKQAYEESYGKFVPSRPERQSRDFDKALDSVQSVAFTARNYMGSATWNYTVSGNIVKMEVVNHSAQPGTAHRKRVLYTKEEFVDGLREFHIREWKKEYIDPEAPDEMQWELVIQFDSGKPYKITGSSAFPYNFREFKEFLRIDLKKIKGKAATTEK